YLINLTFSCGLTNWLLQVSSAASLKTLMARWMMYRDECFLNISREPPMPGIVCNRTFDKYACWPDALPNTTVSVACPWYLPWHKEVQHGFVYLECDADGQYSKQKNASECLSHDPTQINMQHYGRILSQFRTMYTIGYSLSLAALVLALGILVAFRKLHCMRNNIHMNLFASFILRASSILIKDAMLKFSRKLSVTPKSTCAFQTAVGCRVAMVMMQYSILANNYWLLVEGIYLHSLLVVTVLMERNYFAIYQCIGWGAPLIFVLPWVIVKYLYENEECWVQNINMEYWWIIRSPILLAVLINFFIFIHIIKILVSKLRAHQMRYSDYKFRLAKSTLTLIPLLGIHPVLFSFVTDESTSHGALSLRLTKLFIDLFFNSFQMAPSSHVCFLTILCIFLIGQVQSEILKKWRRWKLGRDIEEEYRHTYSQSLQMKSGSIMVPPSNLSRLPDIATTTSRLGSPEEKQMLVSNSSNGMGTGLQFTSTPQDSSTCSSITEDIVMVDRGKCCSIQQDNAKSNL
uniref:Glucagon receptor-like n=1 Tax=Sinocyclocheilus anshuiensis TaxID=1608454 RepID=A0A671MF40_9TELE